MAEREYVANNTQSRNRLETLIKRLRLEDYGDPVDDDWSIGALLAHMAFWDRLALCRWEAADKAGEPIPRALTDDTTDLVNGAAVGQWQALPPEVVAHEALEAAAAVDAHVMQLSDAQIDLAMAAGFVRLLERARHRNEHMDQIEKVLQASR